MCLDRIDRIGQKRHHAATLFRREAAHEAVREQRRVRFTRTKRGHVDDDFGQTVVEILAKLALGDVILEALVRRANDANVDRNLLASADSFDDALLQKAQDLRLERHR